jgi:hypothetical protein
MRCPFFLKEKIYFFIIYIIYCTFFIKFSLCHLVLYHFYFILTTSTGRKKLSHAKPKLECNIYLQHRVTRVEQLRITRLTWNFQRDRHIVTYIIKIRTKVDLMCFARMHV